MIKMINMKISTVIFQTITESKSLYFIIEHYSSLYIKCKDSFFTDASDGDIDLDEDTSNMNDRNLLGPYARSRWPMWLYSIPRPVQRIKRKQHLVNLLARMNKRNEIGSKKLAYWLKTLIQNRT